MLQSLYIRNYLLIDQLEMDFSDGFTTITGETGAGKSILMGALSLILGQRVDTSVLRLKDAKCIVEGSFLCGRELEPFFVAGDLDFEEVSTIRREVAPGGKSRAFINDTPVNLAVLRELGKHLVDIHSQHQNLQLNDQEFQLGVIDFLAGSGAILKEYRLAWESWKDAVRVLEDHRNSIQKLKADREYLEFQLGELHSAALKEGELDSLEAEFQLAGHAEEIGSALSQAGGILNEESLGVLDRLKEALMQLQKISGFYSPVRELAERMDSARIELKDLAFEVENLAGKSEAEPGRLEKLQERIDLLYGLMQKHRVRTLDELISLREEFQSSMDAITFSDEKLAQMEGRRDELFNTVENLAGKLHLMRKKAGEDMQGLIVADLKELGIPHARFSVLVQQNGEYGPSGSDHVSFLFSANKQMEQEEVSRVASGGEVSRLMLAIKALVTDRKGMPTLIFDEIDSGVGGEIAEKVGAIMKRIASGRQVLAITHLPQVASLGQEHFTVYKEDSEHATHTRLRKLEGEERIREIARMLSGEELSEAALSNARVLLRI